jgi:peptidoglycan/LPS O-acetylase OafA/YrhL
MTSAPPTGDKVAFIDAMRGIAIALVVLVHTGQNIDGDGPVGRVSRLGELGVQLFFVASALTLCMSMRRRTAGGGPGELRAFFIRRYFRIAPMYYVGLILYLGIAAGDDGLITQRASYTPAAVAANLALAHGFHPWANNTVVPGGWSIGTEAAFYALFPLIFRFVDSARRAAWFIAASLATALAFDRAFLSVLHRGDTVEDGSFLFHFIVNQLPVFGCGVLLFHLLSAPAERRAAPAFGVAALLGATTIAVFFAHATWADFALVPALSGGAFAALGMALSRTVGAPSQATWLIELGRKSYSIYILHFVAAFLLTPHLAKALGGLGSLGVAFAVNLGLTYLAACATFRWIEQPGIALGKRLVGRLRPSQPAPQPHAA